VGAVYGQIYKPYNNIGGNIYNILLYLQLVMHWLWLHVIGQIFAYSIIKMIHIHTYIFVH